MSVASVIVSPRASRIRDDRARAEIARRITAALRPRGITEIVMTEAGTPDAVRSAARAALDRGSEIVVVAGGDGTIRDAAGPLAGTGTPLGIVPCGTGNLYAGAVGLPRSLDAAADLLATAIVRPFDLGEVEGCGETTSFVVACGTGLDARLIGATSPEMKRRLGVGAYFLAATRMLPNLRPYPTVLTIDGVTTEIEAAVVLIANCGEAIPGFLRPRLPIDPSDGLLHVFALHGSNIVQGLRGVWELLVAQSAGQSSSGAAMRMIGRHVQVAMTPTQPVQVDGDPVAPSYLDARILPGALDVLVPAPVG